MQHSSNVEVKALVINGVARAGKDSFMDALEESGQYNIIRTSIIDPVKELASQFGYDIDIKTNKDRKMLSDLFTVMYEYNEAPFHMCMDTIMEMVADRLFGAYVSACGEGPDYPDQDQDQKPILICVVAREPIHIAQFVDVFTSMDIPVKTVVIRRKLAEEPMLIPNNRGDRAVFRFPYDLHVWNDSTKEKFKERVIAGVRRYNQ